MLNHIKTIRAGDAAFYAKRSRNTIDVYHDQKRYVYEKPDNFKFANRSDWLAYLSTAFKADKVKTVKPLIFEIV
jgi:hypothetical protein